MVEKKLEWLDDQYLSKYDTLEDRFQDSAKEPLTGQWRKGPLFHHGQGVREQATYLSINTVVGDDLDPHLYVAFQVLEYTLLDAQEHR